MKRASRLSVVLAVLALAAPGLGLLDIAPPAASAAVAGSYNLDQCANGGSGSTATTCVEGWENGNLNHTKAHYAEGDSVPYRLQFLGLIPGQYKMKIEWERALEMTDPNNETGGGNQDRSLASSAVIAPASVTVVGGRTEGLAGLFLYDDGSVAQHLHAGRRRRYLPSGRPSGHR